MGEIGAYYQCYNRDQCVDFVLSNFRKYYDKSSIVLVCDGGNDYEEISKKYNCQYFYETKSNTEKNLIFKDRSSVIKFIYRLKKYIELIKEEFFIILEDDVYIMNEISMSELKYDINGCNTNENLHQNLMVKINSKNGFFIGACGGSILKKDFFRSTFKDMSVIKKDIEEYCDLVPQNHWASDRIISYLCYKYGGIIGQYNGFCETWHGDFEERLKKNDIEVLHQYKFLY